MAELILEKSWAVNLKLSYCTRTKTIVFGILPYLYSVNLLIIFYTKLLKIKSQNLVDQISNVFFSIWVFFYEHSWSTGQQWKEETITLALLYHFDLFPRHLDIRRTITADSIGANTAESLGSELNRESLVFERTMLITEERALMSLCPLCFMCHFLSQFLTLNLSLVIYVSKKIVVKFSLLDLNTFSSFTIRNVFLSSWNMFLSYKVFCRHSKFFLFLLEVALI